MFAYSQTSILGGVMKIKNFNNFHIKNYYDPVPYLKQQHAENMIGYSDLLLYSY